MVETIPITAVTTTDTFKSRDIRFAVAKLRTNKVVPKKGNLYWCGIHPEVSLDLRQETGSAAWASFKAVEIRVIVEQAT